jgi:hypothetical protein
MTINIGYDTYKFWNCSERKIEVQIERCKPHADAAKNKDIQAILNAAECLGKVVDLAIGTPADDVIEA